MSRWSRPTEPKIIIPSGGEEVSNLNPNIKVEWSRSKDAYYTEIVTGPQPGYQIRPYSLKDYESSSGNMGFFSQMSEGGRISKFVIDFVTLSYNFEPRDIKVDDGDIVAEFYTARRTGSWHPTYGYRYKEIELIDLIYSDFINRDGEFIIPYNKTMYFAAGQCFVVRLVVQEKASKGDYYYAKAGYGQEDVSYEGTESVGLAYVDNTDPMTSGTYIEDMFYMEEDTGKKYAYWSISGPVGNKAVNVPAFNMYINSGHEDDVQYDVQVTNDNGTNWRNLASRVSTNEMTFNLSHDVEEVGPTGAYQSRFRVQASDRNDDYREGMGETRQRNYSEWVQSPTFTIIKHTNPEKPTNLKVSDTNIIDKNIINRLTWKHNHENINNRQGKAEINWRNQGESNWNVISFDGMSQFYDVPANTFPLGTIEWRVKTWSYVGMESPYSDMSKFSVKDTPLGPTITTPTGLVAEPSPSVAWEHSYIQTHYQINVLDLSDNAIWTTGEVASIALAGRIAKYLANLTTYKIQVRVKTNEGLWSAYTTQLFNTDYQFPAPSIVTVISGSGFITVAYDNPDPTGQQPIVARNEVYKMIDNEWIKISEASPHSFNDYAAANNATNHYFVRSIASNGAYTDSDIKSAKVKVQGVVLYLVNDPEGTMHQFRIDGHGRSKKWSIESSLMRFKGRKHPVIEIGTMEDDVIDFTLIIENEEEKQALDKIIYSGHICCYRDGRGRLAYGIFTEYPETDERWGGYTVNLSLTKIDYQEGSIIEDEDDGIINVVVDGGEY